MPHIEINSDEPGIRGLMAQRPETAAALSDLAETLLRSPLSLDRGERELIAAYTSQLNGTAYCADSHGAFAAAQLTGGGDVVAAVLKDPDGAPITPHLRALLHLAAEVRGPVAPVSAEAVAAARAAGADDRQIHDTVLIAAAFCMFNRYVTCLDSRYPEEPGYFGESAKVITARGYSPPPAS